MTGASLEVGVTFDDAYPLDVDRLAALLRFAAHEEGRAGEVGVRVCSDATIADLHERFMGVSGPTDVLSFPGDGDYLGDIAVSFDTARAQAAEVGHPVGREVAYLALHGLLHLCGYDDIAPDDRARMIARQDVLLERFERDASGDWS